MKIEHLGFQVPDPVAFARWYGTHLGMRTVRSVGAPTYTHFLATSDGAVMLEVYRNEGAPVPDYAEQDPLVVHIGFASEDPAADMARLREAGATVHAEPVTTAAGHTLVMMRDPWGFPIQLCRR